MTGGDTLQAVQIWMLRHYAGSWQTDVCTQIWNTFADEVTAQKHLLCWPLCCTRGQTGESWCTFRKFTVRLCMPAGTAQNESRTSLEQKVSPDICVAPGTHFLTCGGWRERTCQRLNCPDTAIAAVQGQEASCYISVRKKWEKESEQVGWTTARQCVPATC